MQQHAVPQNITGFEFKLIGALTLKQFGYVAGAGIVAFMFFVAVSGFLKWLFIIPTVLLGIALAFVPINGMSFDKWIVALARSIISPSLRVWHKENKEIGFLAPEFSHYLRRAPAIQPETKPGRSRLNAYLAQVRSQKPADKLEHLEKKKLSSLPLAHSEEMLAPRPRQVEVPPIRMPEEIAAKPIPEEVPQEELAKRLAGLGLLEKEEK